MLGIHNAVAHRDRALILLLSVLWFFSGAVVASPLSVFSQDMSCKRGWAKVEQGSVRQEARCRQSWRFQRGSSERGVERKGYRQKGRREPGQ